MTDAERIAVAFLAHYWPAPDEYPHLPEFIADVAGYFQRLLDDGVIQVPEFTPNPDTPIRGVPV